MSGYNGCFGADGEGRLVALRRSTVNAAGTRELHRRGRPWSGIAASRGGASGDSGTFLICF